MVNVGLSGYGFQCLEIALCFALYLMSPKNSRLIKSNPPIRKYTHYGCIRRPTSEKFRSQAR